MDIDFVLSQTDNRPMYQQVMGHIKDRIAVGDWPVGARIPSIRELAAALKVSVITIKRAYQELEYEGTITVQHGRGAFVTGKMKQDSSAQEVELEKCVEKTVKLSAQINEGPERLEERIKKAWDRMMETVE